MKKPAKTPKKSARSLAARGKKKPRGGAAKAVSPALVPKVRGEMILPNGCRVPYEHNFEPGDYRATFYGLGSTFDGKTACLIRHTRRGEESWGYVVNGLQSLLSGDVTRYGLGNRAKSPEVQQLMMSVSVLRELSDAQAWEVQVAGTTGGQRPTHAGRVYAVVLAAIRSGDADLLEPLAICINACRHLGEPSGSQRMHDAVVAAATLHKRPPIPSEIAVMYYGGEGKVPTSWERGAFYRMMEKAGWGWLVHVRLRRG